MDDYAHAVKEHVSLQPYRSPIVPPPDLFPVVASAMFFGYCFMERCDRVAESEEYRYLAEERLDFSRNEGSLDGLIQKDRIILDIPLHSRRERHKFSLYRRAAPEQWSRAIEEHVAEKWNLNYDVGLIRAHDFCRADLDELTRNGYPFAENLMREIRRENRERWPLRLVRRSS